MQKIKNIIIHCSDSNFGTALLIDKWHKENNWAGIGYHFVILNGFPTAKNLQDNNKIDFLDGAIETGRTFDFDFWIEENEEGAHTLGHNKTSIGICVIFKKTHNNDMISNKQMKSLIMLCSWLLEKLNLSKQDILGHYQISENKTCPDFNINSLLKHMP